MRVFVLELGLFPDRVTIDGALARLADENEVQRARPAPDAPESDWDGILTAIRAADVVVTL